MASSWYFPGFILSTEKGQTTKGIYVDDHRVEILREPPSAPLAEPATGITSHNLRVNWSPGSGAVPLSYVVELCPEGQNFAPGSLIAADGTGGQSVGVTVSDSLARTLQFTGLNPATTYTYRIIGLNSTGASQPSATLNATTLGAGANAPPTLDPLPPLLLAADAQEQEIALSGISDGGELDQFLSVWAVSSHPALIPDPVVDYTSPGFSGILRLTPADLATGNASITVTVHDGSSTNATIQRTFEVRVVEPVETVTFDSEDDLAGLSPIVQAASLTHESDAARLRFDRIPGVVDPFAAAFRPERFDPRAASWMQTSLLVNLSAIPAAAVSDKADLWLGFLTEVVPPPKLKDLFAKSAPAFFLRVKAEQSASKDRGLEAELVSLNCNTSGALIESKGAKTSLSGVAALEGWLKIVFFAVRSGVAGYELGYRIESWGAGGSAFESLVASGTFQVVNASVASSQSLFAGFGLSGEKAGGGAFRVDDYAVRVDTRTPDAPGILGTFDTSFSSFRAAWIAPFTGRPLDGFILEVAPAAEELAPGSFLAQDGTPGQSSGILIDDPWTEELILSGLAPSTHYLWRVRAYNQAGDGPALAPRLVQTSHPTYAQWREYHFTPAELAEPTITGDRADPNGNGLGNLLDYAFGFHPKLQTPGPQNPTALEVSTSNRLRLTFRRRTGDTGILYVPEASGDLQNWSSDGLAVVSVSPPDAEGFETVVVEDSVDLATVTRRFLRVRVERSLP